MSLLFIGTPELIVIGVVVLMFFGSDKIPDFARGLGKFIRQVKDAKSHIADQIKEGTKAVDDIKKDVTQDIKKQVETTTQAPEKSIKKENEALDDSYQGPVKRQR